MNIERQIEFDKVKDIWADLAITDCAKEKIREATLYFSETELKKQLRDTTDARFLIEKLGTPPLQNITEIKEVLLIVGKGDCLTPYQLERVERVLVVMKRLKDYLARGKMYQNSLAYYDENLDELSEFTAGNISKKSTTKIMKAKTGKSGTICKENIRMM